MSAGFVALLIAAVLIYCGLLQRVLDRMYMTDRQALAIIACMLAGTFLPGISLGPVTVNLGGAVIPLAVCIYIFAKCNEGTERLRALVGTVVTAGGIYALSRLLPGEAEALLVDPMWLYGLCGGIIAWVLGRSRRAAFICGVVGILLADTVSTAVAWTQGYQTRLYLGGAGIADASVISGVIAVMLCELVGETVERFVCGRAKAGRRAE